MAAPSWRVEMLFATTGRFFNYFVLDTSALDGPAVLADSQVWVDVTAYVLAGGSQRGRQRDIDEFNAGTCHLTIDNSSRYWDPDNTASPFYGQVQPGRQIRVTATVAGVDYQIYQGYAQDWQPNDTGSDAGTMTLLAADGLSILAAQQLATIVAAYSGDTSDARVTRVLNLPEVNYPSSRSIGAGSSTLGATTFGSNAAQYLQAVATSEGGALYVDRNGVLTFTGRGASVGTAAAATFADDGLAASIPYRSVTRSFKVDLLFNHITAAGTSGNVQTADDTASQSAYQVRTLSKTGLLNLNDSDVADMAAFLLAKFATPELRFKELDVDVANLTAAQQASILALDLTSRVQVKQTPLGSSMQISQAAVIDGLDWSFSPGLLDVRVAVSAGSREFGLVLDDAFLGLLGTAFLGY